MKKEYRLIFEESYRTVYDQRDKNLVIASVKMKKNKNFYMQFNYEARLALKSTIMHDIWLWHNRFYHFNFHGLKLLQKKNMVKGLPEIKSNLKPCESCIMGKQHRLSFSKHGAWRAKASLELIHIDIYGQMKTPSLN